jgi:hypothetical protein
MTDTWRFIVVVSLIIAIGALLPFAIGDAAYVTFSPVSRGART